MSWLGPSRVGILDRAWLSELGARAWNRNTRPADYALLVIVGLLLTVGMMMIYSVSVGPNLQGGRANPFSLVERHALLLIVGVALMIIVSRLDYRLFSRQSIVVPLMVVTVVLLFALLIFGSAVEGARRWLLGSSVQPGELAKLVTIIYAAAWLSSKGKKLRDFFYGLVPFSILVGIVAGLIVLQPNLSTALIIASVAFVMFFVAGADLKQFISAAGLGGAAAFCIITQSPHAIQRLNTLWVDPTATLSDSSWQVSQTLTALASGGIFGKGLGTGGGQYGYVPLAHSDGIFAILGEETGLIGTYLVVALFVALAHRGVQIAQRAPDDFGRILAAGITFWLTLQAFVNIGVVTQLIPTTGQPLPFISFGGSALLTALVGVGLLWAISRAKPQPPVVRSVPIVPGAPRGEKEKHATVSYGGRYGRARLSTRRRAATPRRHSQARIDE